MRWRWRFGKQAGLATSPAPQGPRAGGGLGARQQAECVFRRGPLLVVLQVDEDVAPLARLTAHPGVPVRQPLLAVLVLA